MGFSAKSYCYCASQASLRLRCLWVPLCRKGQPKPPLCSIGRNSLSRSPSIQPRTLSWKGTTGLDFDQIAHLCGAAFAVSVVLLRLGNHLAIKRCLTRRSTRTVTVLIILSLTTRPVSGGDQRLLCCGCCCITHLLAASVRAQSSPRAMSRRTLPSWLVLVSCWSPSACAG